MIAHGYMSQLRTVVEGKFTDFGHTVSDHNISKLTTILKGIISNRGYILSNDDFSEISASAKCILTDRSNPIGNNDLACTAEILDLVSHSVNRHRKRHRILRTQISNQRIYALFFNEAETVSGIYTFKVRIIFIDLVAVLVNNHLGITSNIPVFNAFQRQCKRTIVLNLIQLFAKIECIFFNHGKRFG